MVLTHFSVNSLNVWQNHFLFLEAKILQPQIPRPLQIETVYYKGTGP
jgi:hypothetical protein